VQTLQHLSKQSVIINGTLPVGMNNTLSYPFRLRICLLQNTLVFIKIFILNNI